MKVRWDDQYAARTNRMSGSAIRELLKVTERPGFISFAGGLPAPELFPTEQVADVTARIMRDAGQVALQYSATEGYRPLRELIAQRLRDAGVPAALDNVLITTGSQQALDLVGKIMIDPGDRVAVESPTYLAALQAWHAYEAAFVAVPTDDHGMDIRALEEHFLHPRPKLVYCLPNFQNPMGTSLSSERRDHCADIAYRHGLVVLEDDPYHDLRFEGDELPRIIELEAARQGDRDLYRGNVLSLGTFSKILAPGLRVGWVVAAPGVISQLARAKQGVDLHTSTLSQMIAHELLRSGYLDAHRDEITRTYKERRDVMIAALVERFPAGTRWIRPQGGMFLWVELPGAVDAAALLELAMERQVAFVPGQSFHVDGSGRNTLRLNFSNSSPERIREGIGRLAQALEALEGASRHGRALAASVTDQRVPA